KLLDYGFDNFKREEIFPAGYQLPDESTLPVAKGKADTVDIATEQEFSTLINEEHKENDSIKYHFDKEKVNKDGELTAPIKEGEKVGTAEGVYEGEDSGYIFDKNTEHINLVTTDCVDKSNWFMLTLNAIGDFFSNLFSSLIDMIKGWF